MTGQENVYGETSIDGVQIDEAIAKQNKENHSLNEGINQKKQSPEWEEFDKRFGFKAYITKDDGWMSFFDTDEIKSYIKSNFVPKSELNKIIEMAQSAEWEKIANIAIGKYMSFEDWKELTNLLKGE